MGSITDSLFTMQDTAYAEFNSKLIPTVSRDRIIGVRTPLLRKYASEIYGTRDAQDFLTQLPHHYFEENNLHAFLIEKIPDFSDAREYVDAFLPFIDNWATCDSMKIGVFKKNPEALIPDINRWLSSTHIYTVRYGIGLLMWYFLDNLFDAAYLDKVASIKSNEYYVNMMISWFFASALAKQYNAALPYIEKRLLSPWVHNKTIQKATESYRITEENKTYLKSLRYISKLERIT